MYEPSVLGTIVILAHQRIGVVVDSQYFGTVHKTMLLLVGVVYTIMNTKPKLLLFVRFQEIQTGIERYPGM